MKTKVLMFVVLMSLSAVLVAQPADNGLKKSFRGQGQEMRMNNNQRGPGKALNLTDAQKESFKQSILAMHKEVKPVRNELGEALAHQRTLVSDDKPDMMAINKNMEKIGNLKVEIAKIRVKYRLDMRALLTEEQRMKFDMFKARMKQQKVNMAMKHGMGMKPGNSMN